jgi:hypothetical protein
VQSFGLDRVVVAGLHPRVTAFAVRRFLEAIGERPFSEADSTGQRNGLAEQLSRRLEAESLSRPLVQLSRHGVELGL